MSASSDQVAVKVDQADLGGDGKKFTVAEAAPTPGGPTPSGARRTVFKFDRNPSGLLVFCIARNLPGLLFLAQPVRSALLFQGSRGTSFFP